MFQIGDKIFYPMHGGGIVEAIEENDILGKTKLYYVVNILHRNMQVMIPTDRVEKLGIRRIVNPDQLEDLLTSFGDTITDAATNDNQRHRYNMNKMKSGDIYESGEVIRYLVHINNNKKKLGMADKNMLDNALQMLISEIVLVKGISQDQAANLLDQVLNIQ